MDNLTVKWTGGAVLVTLLLLLLIAPVSALSIAFADSTLQGDHQAMIVADNGTLIWEGNTSSTATISESDLPYVNGTLLIHIKPEAKNILESPDTLLAEIGYQVQANLITILFVAVIGLVLFGRRR